MKEEGVFSELTRAKGVQNEIRNLLHEVIKIRNNRSYKKSKEINYERRSIFLEKKEDAIVHEISMKDIENPFRF